MRRKKVPRLRTKRDPCRKHAGKTRYFHKENAKVAGVKRPKFCRKCHSYY